MPATGLNVFLIGPYPLQEGRVVGGVVAVNSTLAQALTAQESVAQVTVLCFHRGQVASCRRRVNDKLQIFYLRTQNRLNLLTRSLLDTWRARRIAGWIEPDVVHGQGMGRRGDIATQISKASVVTVHGLIQVEVRLAARGTLKDRVQIGLVEAMVRRVLRRARVVISISDYDARSLDGLVRGQRVSIPNPIAQEFFVEPRYTSDRMSVLFAGMWIRRKNLEGLLRAFALTHKRVPAARLIVAGPSPDPGYADEIREVARSLHLGDAVDFLGHVENARLVQEIRACRAVALFSHEETSPTIVAQALAMGKPIVASRVGGVPEMVLDHENGFLVDPGDEVALADRLAEVLKSPELCRTMGMCGHEIARRRFEPGAVAHQTVEAYRLARRANRG